MCRLLLPNNEIHSQYQYANEFVNKLNNVELWLISYFIKGTFDSYFVKRVILRYFGEFSVTKHENQICTGKERCLFICYNK